ncbi:hypothetical protein BUE80_DR005189 [Diplocarpon rosae]|nr:hypothetical protein BUE80_DR005189 [Diplocarpon rosae]
MISAITCVAVALAFIVTSSFLLVRRVKSCAQNEQDIIATPTISRDCAVFTSFGSTRIKGSPDDVFAAILDFETYSTWSPYVEYKWSETGADGLPSVGSSGTFQLTDEDTICRTIPVRLTMLDLKRRVVSEVSTMYPRWLLASERVQEVLPIESSPGYCEYRTYHTYEGFASYYLLLATREDMIETERQCASDLDAFIQEKTSFGKTKK